MKKMIALAISFLIASLALCDYSETCKDIKLTSATISAKCIDSEDQYISTQIRLRGVTNVNGELTFLKDTRKKSYFYKECKNVTISTNGVISAECPDAHGTYISSSLSTNDVLINDNGSLVYPAKEQLDFISTCRNIQYYKSLFELSADCLAENGGRYKSRLKLRGISVLKGKLFLTHDSKDYVERLILYCGGREELDAEGNIAAFCFKGQQDTRPTGPKLWSLVNIRSTIVNKNGSLVVINQ